GIGLAELLEQLSLLLRGHPDAGVGDGELDDVAAIAHFACRKLDLARFGELRRGKPVAPNDRHRLQRDLARKIETDAGRRTRHIELDERAIDRAAARMSAADLSLNDLAEVVADAIKSSERRIRRIRHHPPANSDSWSTG